MKTIKMLHSKATPLLAGLCFILVMGLSSCEYNKNLDLEVTATQNITGYLEANKDQFSELLQLMDRSITLSTGQQIKYSSFLGAYGTYTLFAPTNDAINTYLKDKKGGKTIDQLTDSEVRKILNFHILRDTISSTNFTDGKIGVATMLGQYLITGSVYNGTSTRIQINKQAFITQKNIKLGNGLLHIIDGVLEPAEYTLYQMLKNQAGFSIFTQALEATGYADTLNVTYADDVSATKKRWLTVLATSDSVYHANKIKSFDDLKATYSHLNDPKNTADSLHLYMGYHIVNSLNFVADLSNGMSYNTLTANNVVSIVRSLDTVLINQFTINKVLERGVSIIRNASDNTSTNGVWHSIKGNYYIRNRKPEAVYWDMCSTFPGLKSLVGSSGSASIASGQIDGITYNSNGKADQFFYVKTGLTAVTETRLAVNTDFFAMQLISAAAVKYMRFTTPFIAAGKYKVWLCYIEMGNGYNIQIQGAVGTGNGNDSTILTNAVATSDYLPDRGGRTLLAWDNYLQGIGYKRYMQVNAKNYANKNMVGRLMGTVTFTTSGLHWISFTTLTAGRTVNDGNKLDMVHFIPSTDNQIWPKFTPTGTAIPEPLGDYNDDTDEGINAIMNQ